MKDKICFIGFSWHKKTKSCDFMVDYLKNFYEVDVFYDSPTVIQKEQAIDFTVYKSIIFWQLIPSPEILNEIGHDNMVFFPMYDDARRWSFEKWFQYRHLKIVSFSKTLHKSLKRWGFNSIYVQYFIKPKDFSPGAEDEVFFWQRRTAIDIRTVKRLFKKSGIKLHLHKALDPYQKFHEPGTKDEKNLQITYSEWFDTKEDMENLIASKAVYIAPRLYEGIGMSFLEALAQGKAIIANNAPTMSEYIVDGKTGYLRNFKFRFFTRAVNLSQLREIQKNAYEYAKKGYENWLEERKMIIDLIEAPNKEYKISPFKKFLFECRIK